MRRRGILTPPPPFNLLDQQPYHGDDLTINSSEWFRIKKTNLYYLLSETHQQHHREIQFEECERQPSISCSEGGEKLHLCLNNRRGSRWQENCREDEENASMEAILFQKKVTMSQMNFNQPSIQFYYNCMTQYILSINKCISK